MAGLQQLAARRPEVVAGVSTEQQGFLDELAKQRSKDEAGAGSEYDKLITEANKIAASTTADYGNLPKEQLDLMPKMPTVTPKTTPKTTPKAPAKPPVKVTPQKADSARLAALTSAVPAPCCCKAANKGLSATLKVLTGAPSYAVLGLKLAVNCS